MSNQSTLENSFHNVHYLESGGVSHLYLAQERISGQQVILKTLKDDFRADPIRRERFRQEALLQSRVRHPAVVQVLDYFEDGNRQWIVLEYAGAETLWQYLKSRTSPHVPANGEICRGVCESLAVVHQAGIIHNDIKTLNFLIGADGTLKLTDFGEAVEIEATHNDVPLKTLWGSPLYTAPEVSAGARPQMASDVYSAGIILYQIFAGKLPFFSQDAEELTRLHRTEAPLALRALNPEVTPELEAIVLRALRKNPAERFPNGSDLLAAINRVSA